MTFKINNSVGKSVAIEQLIDGLDAKKDKEKIARIQQIFSHYNTDRAGASQYALGLKEQLSLLNDLHRADGDGKGKDFDGKVSSRGLKRAGLSGDYKAYQDFYEAYQKALGENENGYELTFDGDNLTAKRSDTLEGEQFEETMLYKNNDKELHYEGKEVALGNMQERRDAFGHLVRQTIDGTVLQYDNFDSDKRNAKAGIIKVTKQGEDVAQTLELQQDGTYLDKTDNSHYRLDKAGLPKKFAVDEQNRVTAEVWGENEFKYTYNDGNNAPASVTVAKNGTEVKKYISEGELYTSMNGETKEYFTFDAEKRTFQKTDAPQPKQVEKQARPTGKRQLIRMTAGWKNQKIKPDAEMTAKFNAMSTADDVLDALLENVPNKENLNLERLKADLIRNNPSMFQQSSGAIYSDAKWDKLDFPKNNLTMYNK